MMLRLLIILVQVLSCMCLTIGFGPQPQLDLCYYGQRQSPIYINEELVDPKPARGNLTFVNHHLPVYEMKLRSSFENRTVTIFADPKQKMHVILSNGTGRTAYLFYSMHFHWGCSEHMLSSDPYYTITGFNAWRMELHFVYFDQAYGSYEAARLQPNGLFAYSTPYRYFDRYWYQYREPNLQKFLDFIANPGRPDQNNVMSLTWQDFLFNTTFKDDSLYFYEGSMASYPCAETVLWGINRYWKWVGELQVLDFQKKFYNWNHTKVAKNCRHFQLLHGRKVLKVNYNVTTGFHDRIPPNREFPSGGPGEGIGGGRLPPNWLIYLVPAFILGGITYMHRHYDWSFLDHLQEGSRGYA